MHILAVVLPQQYPQGERPRGAAEEVGSVARACDILTSWHHAGEVLQLREIAARARVNKSSACRILATLVGKGLVERAGLRGYRCRFQPLQNRIYRIGYASQSNVIPFISTVTDSLIVAADAAGVELVVLNNNATRKQALRNAERLIEEKVDLAIEFQLFWNISGTLAAKYSQAGIPLIAVDNPHAGAVYFGAEHYKAGQLGGRYMARWIANRWRGELDQIILIGVSAAGPVVETRLNGMLDGLLEMLPGARSARLFRYDTKAVFDLTLELTRRHLMKHRGRRIAVGAVNDIAGLAAHAAFTELGLEDSCIVMGQGGVQEARAEMRRKGSRMIGSVAYFPEKYGERIIKLALDMLGGKQVPAASFTNHLIINAENVNHLYPNDQWMPGPAGTY